MSTLTKTNKQQAKAVHRRILRAAELIEERGWTRGASGRKDGVEIDFPFGGTFDAYSRRLFNEADCFCAIGAIEASFHDRLDDRVEAFQYVEAVLGEDVSIDVWNDDIARDRRQVARVIRKAAKVYAEEQGIA